MVDHFKNTAVYACILYLERGAAVLMLKEIRKIFINKRDELFNNADETMIQGIKLFQELIHEDNTSLSFYQFEVEKSITKLLRKRNLLQHLKRIKQRKRKTQMQQHKKNPRKDNSKSNMQKSKNKTTVIRSHIKENLCQKLKWQILRNRKTL